MNKGHDSPIVATHSAYQMYPCTGTLEPDSTISDLLSSFDFFIDQLEREQ